MIRLVLDTNVIVSGLLSPAGPPGLLVDLFSHRMIDLVYSDDILLEYADALGRRELKLRRDDVDSLIQEIQARGISVAAAPWPVTVPDASDSSFLAAALAGQAMLVTGNMRHYPPSVRLGVEVISPRTFVDQFVTGLVPSERRSKRQP